MKIQLELTPQMVDQLRYVIDGLPICSYGPLILAVLPRLPLESESDPIPAPDATPASSTPVGAGAGFSLVGFSDKGKAALPELTRLLSRLPHCGKDSL